MRRVPVLATLVVLAAVAVMIRLGIWQIGRMHEKDAMLARFARSAAATAPIALPATETERGARVYQPATAVCARIAGRSLIGGRDAEGQTGWVQLADCRDPAGRPFAVAIGVSTRPETIAWAGGPVQGRIANAGEGRTRLIADAPGPGMRRVAPPDPAEIPNNHWSYAIQWFLFAATALVIYAIALAKRLAAASPRG